MVRGGPLIVTGTVQLYRSGVPVGPSLSAHIDEPETEPAALGDPVLWYEVQVAPAIDVQEADRLVVTVCPSNPALVTTVGEAWSVSRVRPKAGLIPCTYFRGYVLYKLIDGVIVPVYLQANAVVSGAKANGSERYASRLVRIGDPPQPIAQNFPGGVAMPGNFLYDTPDSTWKRNDQITILSLVGHPFRPDTYVFLAARVERVAGAVPFTVIELDGGPTFPS